METKKLYELALAASQKAYCPYSKFHVGAALLCADGTVFTGANVENRSFGATNCAERSALFAAVSAGHTKFVKIAIATPDAEYPVGPCGICRQVLSEFMAADAEVIFGHAADQLVETTLSKVYPFDSLHELKA